jgi:hypothetical protein
MALRDQPYIPLYVQDFLTDEKLMECSAKATGVYVRMICIMHKSENYGTILLKQKDKQNDSKVLNFALKLAKFLPYTLDVIESSLTELLNEKVLFIEDDLLCQKRMMKDGSISDKRALAGSKGGKKTMGVVDVFAQAKNQANSEDENEVENDITIDNNIIYKEALLKNENWIKTIATESKKTEAEVKQKLEGFLIHLATELKIHPSVNEFAKHFKYWLPKNIIENGKSNSSSKSNSNNGYKPAKVDREKLIRELAEDAANGNIPGDYSQRRT